MFNVTQTQAATVGGPPAQQRNHNKFQIYKVLKMVRVGVVGYGHLGQYLVESIAKHQDLELAWVWNRSPIHGKVEEKFILEELADCAKNNPDVIVEVAHPDITR